MTDLSPRIFLDTDIGPDCDDTAALAILLQLCREGRARLLGVTHCTGSAYGLAAIDAICRLFGVNIPVGTCADRAFLSDGQALCYTPAVAERFAHGYPPDAPQPDALDAFCRAMRGQPDGSVTFVGIGPMKNIARFFADEEGGALMRAKVRRMVVMAGRFETEPPVPEWNVEMDVPSARYVAENWAGPLDFCPFEALADVLTGECLRGTDSPVETAYRLHTRGTMLRPSWDLETVAAAVCGARAPFAWSEPGEVTIDERGVTRFTRRTGGNRRYLRLAGGAGEAAAELEALLARAVRTMAEKESAAAGIPDCDVV